MAWLHAWAGLVLSLILYFVFITGSFGYFNAEVDHWMKPEQPHYTKARDPSKMVRLGLDYLQREAPEASAYYVTLPAGRENNVVGVYASLTSPGPDGKTYLREQLDPETAMPLAAVRETGGGRALYVMHYRLHYLPYDVAIYIVGIATLFMLLALITGIVVHKKIFVDFFTLRIRKGQRSWLDAHNMSSVFALPFLLMITYSGLVFYTFEYFPGVMGLTMGFEEQAVEELEEHLRPGGGRPEPSGTEASMIDADVPLATAMALWPGAEVRNLYVFNPGDSNAMIAVRRVADSVSRTGNTLRFNGVTGELIEVPTSLPADLAFSDGIISLHEGHFANVFLRWLYFLSGLVGAAMVATGLLLWTKKRRTRLGKKREAGLSLVFVERSNLGIIVGLPLGIGAYFWANRLLPVGMEDRADWEMHCLFLFWAASFLHAGVRHPMSAWREQVGLLAVMFLLLPVLNALTTDTHLVASLSAGNWVRAGFDLTALVSGLALCLVWRLLPEPVAAETATRSVPAADLSRPSAGEAGA